MGAPLPSIARWWKRYLETGGVDDAPRSGRPECLSPTQKTEVANNGEVMVEVNGIEPMTSCVQGRRSPS